MPAISSIATWRSSAPSLPCSTPTTAASPPNTAATCRAGCSSSIAVVSSRRLLAKPRIYLSDYFHQRYDAPARANLRRAVNEKR